MVTPALKKKMIATIVASGILSCAAIWKVHDDSATQRLEMLKNVDKDRERFRKHDLVKKEKEMKRLGLKKSEKDQKL